MVLVRHTTLDRRVRLPEKNRAGELSLCMPQPKGQMALCPRLSFIMQNEAAGTDGSFSISHTARDKGAKACCDPEQKNVHNSSHQNQPAGLGQLERVDAQDQHAARDKRAGHILCQHQQQWWQQCGQCWRASRHAKWRQQHFSTNSAAARAARPAAAAATCTRGQRRDDRRSAAVLAAAGPERFACYSAGHGRQKSRRHRYALRSSLARCPSLPLPLFFLSRHGSTWAWKCDHANSPAGVLACISPCHSDQLFFLSDLHFFRQSRAPRPVSRDCLALMCCPFHPFVPQQTLKSFPTKPAAAWLWLLLPRTW